MQSLKQQRRKLMNKVRCVQHCFSMYICAKQAQMEPKSPFVHPRTEKSIGVDLLVPPIVYPPRYSADGGSPVDICLGLCLVRSELGSLQTMYVFRCPDELSYRCFLCINPYRAGPDRLPP